MREHGSGNSKVNLTYETEIVCVCEIAYSSRTGKNLRQNWHAHALRSGRGLRKTVPSLSIGKGHFCSSETKHDRRTKPRPKLLVSARRLNRRRLHHRKSILGSSPDEMASVARKRQNDGAGHKYNCPGFEFR
jgi:hypothetical protein